MRYSTLIFVLFFLPLYPAFAEEQEVVGTLGSIDGGKSIQVRNGKNERTLHSGEDVHLGDQILTGPEKLVTLHVSDGSVLVIGRKSTTQVDSSPDAASAINLESGTMRAIISKINRNEKKKKFRFMVRTKSVVIGVRGTDFVIEADSKEMTSNLHTLEGTVEVAKDEALLVEKGGILVAGGQAVVATPERIEEPKVFNPDLFSAKTKSDSGITVPVPTPTASPSPSPEIAPSVVAPQSRSSLFSLQAGFRMESIQDLKSNSGPAFGANLGWTPTWALLGNWLAIRGNVAVNYLFPSALFPNAWWILEAGPILSLCLFDHLLIETGPEFQEWIWNDPNAPIDSTGKSPSFFNTAAFSYQASLGWYFPNGMGFLKKVNRIFVEFKTSNPSLGPGSAQQVRGLTIGIAGRF